MDGPETVIALSAVARNSGPIALIFLWAPSKSHSVGGGLKITFSGGWSQNHIQWGVVSKSHSVGGGQAPRGYHSGSLSTAGLSNSPPSLGLPHLKYEWFSSASSSITL